jgi:hypothetical protein
MKIFHLANLFLPRQSHRRGIKCCGAFDDGTTKLPRWTYGSRIRPCGATQRRGAAHMHAAPLCMARHIRMHHACINLLAPSLAD